DYPRWKARLYAAYMTLRKYPHVSFTVETEHHQEVIRTHVFMVSNNSYDLSRIGIEAPRSMMTEGRLTVYWLPHLPRMALMRQPIYGQSRSEEHTSELQSHLNLVCRLLLEKKKVQHTE